MRHYELLKLLLMLSFRPIKSCAEMDYPRGSRFRPARDLGTRPLRRRLTARLRGRGLLWDVLGVCRLCAGDLGHSWSVSRPVPSVFFRNFCTRESLCCNVFIVY